MSRTTSFPVSLHGRSASSPAQRTFLPTHPHPPNRRINTPARHPSPADAGWLAGYWRVVGLLGTETS